MSLEQALNDEERLAQLDLDQLKQLVGLVEYDASGDPFPVSGWDALVWVVGNATQTAHFHQSVLGMELVEVQLGQALLVAQGLLEGHAGLLP